jgi:hypothetical protein
VRGIISPPPLSSPLKGEEMKRDHPLLKEEELEKNIILGCRSFSNPVYQ